MAMAAPTSKPPLTRSQAGQRARQASPWNKSAHCVGKAASLSYARYRKNGKRLIGEL